VGKKERIYIATNAHLGVALVEHQAVYTVVLAGFDAIDVKAMAHAHLVGVYYNWLALEEYVL
jgi:hypothetical protein